MNELGSRAFARILTERQAELVRHALGLDGTRTWSYRNHFVAGPGHDDYADWMAIVEVGAATRRDGKRLPFGGDDIFHVKWDAARSVLKATERLDREDFPELRAEASGQRPAEGGLNQTSGEEA